VGIISALVVGDRTGISAAQWDLLSATGTNHLLVISGLHVSFVALIAYWLVNLASRLSIRLLQRFPAQQLGAAGAVVAALIYSGLAGFSLPTQRALVMVCIAMLPLLVARRSSPSHSFLLAMTLVLVRDPLAATLAGFWLSFTAVGALLLACTGQLPGVRRMTWRRRVLQGWVKPQWVVSLGLLVPLLFWTGQVSLLSPVANMLAIPLVSFWVVPLALGGALLLLIWPPGGAVLLSLADLGIGWLWNALAALAAHLQPLWQSPVPGFTAGLLAAAGCLLLLLPRGLLPRWPGLCLLLPLIWPPPRPAPGAGSGVVADAGCRAGSGSACADSQAYIDI
jgi:competence protein ComEC